MIHGTASTNINNVFSGWSVSNNNFSTGRQASANYVVGDAQIVGCVGENFSAWHCGGVGRITNQNSIGIEHVNSYIGNINDPNTYLFNEATINNGAKLVAEICKRLGIAPNSETIVPHRSVYATACPQTLDMKDYIKRVQSFYNGSTVQDHNRPNVPTENNQNTNKGVVTMYAIYWIPNVKKNGEDAYFFNGVSYEHIHHPDGIKILQDVYRANNGKDMPVYHWGDTAPWWIRLDQPVVDLQGLSDKVDKIAKKIGI